MIVTENSNEQKINPLNLCLMLSSLVIIGAGLQATKIIVIPIFISYITFILLTPLAGYLDDKFTFSRRAYAGIIFFAFIFASFIFARYFWYSMNQLINELSGYYGQVSGFLERYIDLLQQNAPKIALKEVLQKEISSPLGKIIGASSKALNNFLQILGLSFICSLFFVFDPFSLKQLTHDNQIKVFEERLRRYILIKSLTSFVTSLVITTYLYLMGYNFLMFVALMTFLFNFIPSFGSIFATAMLIPIFGIEGSSVSDIMLHLIFPASIQFCIGNVVEPRLLGKSLDLGPVVIIFSLIFWSIIFGVYGLFLAVPFSLAVDTLVKKMDIKGIIYQRLERK